MSQSAALACVEGVAGWLSAEPLAPLEPAEMLQLARKLPGPCTPSHPTHLLAMSAISARLSRGGAAACCCWAAPSSWASCPACPPSAACSCSPSSARCLLRGGMVMLLLCSFVKDACLGHAQAGHAHAQRHVIMLRTLWRSHAPFQELMAVPCYTVPQVLQSLHYSLFLFYVQPQLP